MSDFYEDEAVEDAAAAFEAGDKGITEQPLTYSFTSADHAVTLMTSARVVGSLTFGGQPMTRRWL